MHDKVIEVPIIYPVVSITLKTVSVIDGRACQQECEEIFNADQDFDAMRLVGEFKDYVAKVRKAAEDNKEKLQQIADEEHPGNFYDANGLLPTPAEQTPGN